VAGDMGFSELTIAGLLGHTGRGVTQRYVHLDKALVMAADKVAEEIEQALHCGAAHTCGSMALITSFSVSCEGTPRSKG